VTQARQLAEQLSTAHLSSVYSSDLQRAHVTAEIIAGPSMLKVRADPAWREIDMGDWEGRTVSALHDEAPQLVERLFVDPESFKFPEGESFSAGEVRLARHSVLQISVGRLECDRACEQP
jgi:broad specificity phosphatase PhoE